MHCWGKNLQFVSKLQQPVVWGTFLAVQDVNSIHNQPVTRVSSRLHVDTSTVLLQTPVSPLTAAACPAAGWLAGCPPPDGDAFSVSPFVLWVTIVLTL